MNLLRRASLAVVGVTAALIGSCAWATPQRLDCVLDGNSSAGVPAGRPLVVTFDEDIGALLAEQSGQTYSFKKVSITNTSITGLTDDFSVGIDRSSLAVVWQHYEAHKVSNDFGRCSLVVSPK
jgi:hypothetical protein